MAPFKSLLLLFIFPSLCFAQPQQPDNRKLQYEDFLYLNNLLFETKNPISISYQPLEVTNFDFNYLSRKGDFKRIGEGKNETILNGKIYGIKKIDRLSFEGGIEYSNAKLNDKKWTNTLFVADDNPFFLSDSIASDVNSEKFNLNGGLSYLLNKKWIVALRAIYNVGSLADQTDPRPKTKGIQFTLNPGINYRLNDLLSIGASANIGWMSESTAYTVVNTSEPNVNTLFLQKGLGSPEIKNAIGYKREYDGNQWGGNIQFIRENLSSFSNVFDLGVLHSKEKAKDGGTDFDYNGGDYKATTFTFADRIRLGSKQLVHNLSMSALYKKIDGTWYIQTQSIDKDGNTIWGIKDKSIVHKDNSIQAYLLYRMDLLKGENPHLSWSVGGKYLNSEIKQYPELYKQKYSLMSFSGNITKHIIIGKSLLTFGIDGELIQNLSDEIAVSGSKLASSFLEPAFRAISASAYSGGLSASYKRPMKLSGYPFIFSIYTKASLEKYNDQDKNYKKTDRKAIHFGVSLVF
ncbi:MAG: hypothetical protein PHG27_02395 [Massilibacteroides sp.]|nr:hypothetical protein [Massilibacteroides sp.]MDD3062501.1 hypothetical protein [Massilibacteroides sp.]MDD4114436.1 hypothetical protein [Massilibacteroides sp.]MDD4660353.1 hypothetical protein [Massilibacteroides sp.]